MKFYIKIGNYLFDYILLTLLLIISGGLILPLYGVIVGSMGFFETGSYKSIFKTIKHNIVPIIFLTLIQLLFGGLLLLNLLLGKSNGYDVITILSLILLLSLIVILIFYPPLLLLKMDISFKQLLRNTVYLVLVQFKYTTAMLVISGLMIYLSFYTLWVLLLIVPWLQSIYYMSNKAIEIERKKKEKGETL